MYRFLGFFRTVRETCLVCYSRRRLRNVLSNLSDFFNLHSARKPFHSLSSPGLMLWVFCIYRPLIHHLFVCLFLLSSWGEKGSSRSRQLNGINTSFTVPIKKNLNLIEQLIFCKRNTTYSIVRMMIHRIPWYSSAPFQLLFFFFFVLLSFLSLRVYTNTYTCRDESDICYNLTRINQDILHTYVHSQNWHVSVSEKEKKKRSETRSI